MLTVVMRRFALERDRDVTGVSGTGRVAEGVMWTDGTVDVHWLGARPSWVHWRTLGDAEAIHGHDATTRVVWLDR